MEHEPYEVRILDSFLEYEFYSRGPRGRILKRVVYSISPESPQLYNLSFGDVDKFGKINDQVITDNKDSIKVLATVACTVASFLNAYPSKGVYAFGSTEVRTRLYRIAISNNLEDFQDRFKIYGFVSGQWQPFRKNIDYKGFIVGKNNFRGK
ncbi:MAG: hypothetical protein WDO14_01590 [Bacteroidota bacterium]